MIDAHSRHCGIVGRARDAKPRSWQARITNEPRGTSLGPRGAIGRIVEGLQRLHCVVIVVVGQSRSHLDIDVRPMCHIPCAAGTAARLGLAPSAITVIIATTSTNGLEIRRRCCVCCITMSCAILRSRKLFTVVILVPPCTRERESQSNHRSHDQQQAPTLDNRCAWMDEWKEGRTHQQASKRMREQQRTHTHTSHNQQIRAILRWKSRVRVRIPGHRD